MSCADLRDRGVIERYVARRLEESEAAAFEDHLAACPSCQAEVRLAVAVRAAAIEATHLVGRVWPKRAWWGAGLAAAGVVGLLFLRSSGPNPELTALGGVIEPPIYLGVPVRAADEPADSQFAHAMVAYGEGRYEESAAGIEAALAVGVDSVPAGFFLGASLLMLDRPEEAAERFRRVLALGDSPYLPESRFYLAKSLLRLGRGGEALRELELAARADDEVGRRALALADSVRAVRR
jgi:tetratricopeptide (TPR) repeat protein